MKRLISILSAFLLLACMAGSAAALDIQPTVLPDGTVGVSYSQILQATGGTGPFAFSATGLPAGLSIASDGTISGTPTTAVDMGGYGFIAHVSDQGTGDALDKSIGIKINPAQAQDTTPPSISVSADPDSGNVYTVTAIASDASGISSITIYSAQGTFGDHGAFTSKTCGSSPCQFATGGSNQYVYYATATDASPNHNVATATMHLFTISSGSSGGTPAPAISIQPTVLPEGTVGVFYSQSFHATGGVGPFTFSATGLPAGLSISPSGTVSGTPTTAVDMTGQGFIVHVSDQGTGDALDESIGIKINPAQAQDTTPPSITVSADPDSGNVYTVTAIASDASGISSITIYSAQGTFGDHGAFTSKTCGSSPCQFATGGSNSYVYYATATDASPNHNIATATMQLFTIPSSGTPAASDTAPPSITASANWDSGNVYTVYATASDASGISSITIYSAQGTLASHGAFTSHTCSDSRTCMYATGGSSSYVYYATATDASPNLNTATSDLQQFPSSGTPADTTPPSVSASVAPYGSNGGNIYTITAIATDASGISNIKIYVAPGTSQSNHGAYTLEDSCSSSPCIFTTGDIYGSYVYYATATDASSNHNSASSAAGVFTLPFSPQSLIITTSSLPDATAGQLYNFTLQASGGVTPYSWSLVQGGAIFSGLNVNSQGQVFGTPANSGIGLITFRVTDYNGNSTDKALSFQVSSGGAPGFQITTSSLPGGVIGQQYGATIYVNGTAIPSSWSIPSGALPPGLILSPGTSSAAIVGAPNATGTYSFEVQVTESGTGRVAQMVYVVIISSTTPSNGGTGGSGGGSGSGGGTAGGAYGITTKVAFTCAGEATKVSVNYAIPTAPSALVEIYYVGGNSFSKVFSQNASSTSVLSFVPEKSGPYELHVSVDTTQATSDFLVPDCGLPSANQTHEIAVNLAGQRELVFSRTVGYAGGFSKTFNVYRVLDGGTTSYSTDITLTYTNQGAAKQNMAIADSVPKEVLASPGSIIFQNSPAATASTPEPIFSWNITRMPAGGNVSYAYRIDRPLTDQMIDTFDAPRVLAAGETIQVPASSSATSNLLAASIGFAGFTMPLSTLLYAFGGLVVLALVMLLVFGRKRDED